MKAGRGKGLAEEFVRSGYILGTEGGAEITPLTVVRFKDNRHKVEKIEMEETNGFDLEVSHFIDCVKNKKKPIADVEQGITIMKIIDALYKSSRTGRLTEFLPGNIQSCFTEAL